MRNRLLVRHFLWRFLDHDLIAPGTDRHVILAAIGGAVVGVSLFAAVLIAWMYQLNNTMPPGIASVRAIDDRFFFISGSMLIMALAAVAEWDALALDARDAAVLGVLPIPRGAIVRAKFTAIALFASGALAAWNLCPMLLRGVSLPIGLKIGIAGALQLMVAQGIVGVAAGAFGFLAVLGLRETMFALFGARRFQAVTAPVQAGLIVMLVTAGLLLPPASMDVARRLMSGTGLAAKTLPPLWFVGLHETLAGSVIDRLPRTVPDPWLVKEEQRANGLYRELWPRNHELAVTALTALSMVSVVAVLASLWNSRRLPTPVHRAVAGRRLITRVWQWGAVHLVARTPLRQAGFFFTLQAVFRRVSHRVPMAASLAVGLSFVVLTAGRSEWLAAGEIGDAPLAILAAQSLLIASLLGGFLHVAHIPAELRAGTTFRLAWTGEAAPYLAGVTRAALLVIVTPALLTLVALHVIVLGPRLAMLHGAIGLALAALAIGASFHREQRLAFVSTYPPGGNVKLRGVLALAAVWVASFAFAALERSALASVPGTLTLLTALVAPSFVLSVIERRTRRVGSTLEIEDRETQAVQCLNLAQ